MGVVALWRRRDGRVDELKVVCVYAWMGWNVSVLGDMGRDRDGSG